MTGLLEKFEDWYETAASTWRNLKPGAPNPKSNQQLQSDDLHRDRGQSEQGSRGLVLPGYRYLGPFNDLNQGEPVNDADAAAKRHDEAYERILQDGDNPYIKYNWADRQFQEELADDTSWGGNLGKAVFQAKKRLLEPIGLVNDNTPPPIKKPRLEPNTEAEGGGGQPGGAQESVDIPTMSSGGGSGMGSEQPASDGVGTASGNWHCDSKWLGDTVVTRSTRTWLLPSYNNHIYKQISGGSDANNSYFGYSTPWAYFDFNRFHCHWSPRDWQRLINNHYGFRPKSLSVKIFNIQVKEVATQNSETQITNNLTSTVQIFPDQEYQLPYVMSAATEGSFPPFPADVFMLPQYAYCTLQNWQSNSDVRPTDRSAFYCLEYFPSQMLRTGNSFAFTYNFPELPFHSGYAPSQALNRLANPLLDQYLWYCRGTGSDGATKYRKCIKDNWSEKYNNYCPGPFWKTQGFAINHTNAVSKQSWDYSNKYEVNMTVQAMRPGPNGMSNYDYQTSSGARYAMDNSIIYVNETVAPNHTSERDYSQVLINDEQATAPVNMRANATAPTAASNQQKTGNDPKSANLYEKSIQPGNCWMDRDVYLQGPIWAKIPAVDGTFHPTPNLGGFGMKNPPPMILIRNTAVPAEPPTSYAETVIKSFINEYSTGQVTVEMTWEVIKESSKRWNPEIQYTTNYPNKDMTRIDFAPGTDGIYRYNHLVGTRYLTKHL